MAAVGIAGAILASGVAAGAVCLGTAAAGVGALAGAISEEMQKDRLMAIAGRDPVELRVEALTLKASHVEAFGRSIASSEQMERLAGGSLVLKDGSTRKLAYSVRDQHGKYLFSVAAAKDGGIEIFSFGEAGRKAAWSAYLNAIADVALAQLAPDGWKPAPTSSTAELFRLVRENPTKRRKDQLVAKYHADKGYIFFKTDGWQDGRKLFGAECVNIDRVLAAFMSKPAPTPPVDKDGGAARVQRPHRTAGERELER